MAYATAPLKPSITMKRSVQDSAAKDMSKPRSDPPTLAMLKDAGTAVAEHPPHMDNKLKDDENPTKPYSIASARDLEDFSQDIRGWLEGKETEQNWDKRRKAIIKASRITHGNAPVEYRAQYTSFIKSHLDGILKVVDSLRTNVSAAGLNLLQHIAITLGNGVDFMVDFVVDTLITRSCNTSKVKRDIAIATFETIVSNATCNKNLLHYIMSASEHKDPNARTAVSSWLTALLTKNGRHCDQVGVLDLIDKCIKNGLNDAKPQVRTPMRATYATYANIWPDRAERLKASLDLKTQKMLEGNAVAEPAKSSLKRPSIRDIKAAKKKEMDAQEIACPGSPPSHNPSIKDTKAAKMREMEAKGGRPTSAQSNRPSAREPRATKKRDMEAEDTARPPSAQSTRPPTRDIKTTKKRDVDGGDAVRLPAAPSNPPLTKQSSNPMLKKRSSDPTLKTQPSNPTIKKQPSNPTLKKQDSEVQNAHRPMSAHIPASLSERRFHILSSAPMRPQRGFIDVKRVPSKTVRTLQQEADSETSPLPQADDYRSSRQTERKFHGSRKENIPTSRPQVSQLGHTTAKIVQFETDENEKTTSIQIISAPPTLETELARLGSSARVAGTDVQGVLFDNDNQIERQAKAQRNGPTSVKHDRTQVERPIEIHEDEVSTDQDDRKRLPRVTKRRSGDRTIVLKDVAKLSSHKRTHTPPNPHPALPSKKRAPTPPKSHTDLSSTKRTPTPPKTHTTSSSTKRIPTPPNSRTISSSTKRTVTPPESHTVLPSKKVSPTPSRTPTVLKRRSSTPPTPPTVLREIDQLNQTVEPAKDKNNARRKYISTEVAERNRSVSPHTKDPAKARTQLFDAIGKIRAHAMDDYGYRRLQGIIKMHDTLFEDEQRCDDLLLALLETLETPNAERRRRMTRQFENKFQILVTIRLMLARNKKYFAVYYPRTLSALITARRNFESRCHIVGGLEETAEDITAACAPAEMIDHVLDVLGSQEYDEAGYRATSMGLHILRGLVARIRESEITNQFQEQRLTKYALKCLHNENSEIRRGTIAFCVELRRVIRPEEKYFKLVTGNDEALKSLLTYFIATTRRK